MKSTTKKNRNFFVGTSNFEVYQFVVPLSGFS